MSKPDNSTSVCVTRCLNLFMYNAPVYDSLRRIFEHDLVNHVNHLAILEVAWNQGLPQFMNQLDFAHQCIFIQIAIDKYWEEARAWYNVNMTDRDL